MFGEDESESPRVPSPWDPFFPSPPNGGVSPTSTAGLHNGIPKLVPEVEEGNIEYKLKLTHISNARFTRLVTQLKWRLLEGGGQAYYELGVADSGALIGLSRADLEESLETLEMMAGDIGASVIVVKEIEVPPTIAAIADKDSGYTDPDTGEWTRKMRRRPRIALPNLLSDGGDGSTSTTPTEAETDFPATDFTDLDDAPSSVSSLHTSSMATPFGTSTPATAFAQPVSMATNPVRTHPSLPTAQSSPFIAPIDDDLALFSMEPEPEFLEDPPDTLDVPISGVMADDEADPCRASFGGLEISAVYKPRPVRHREWAGVSLALGSTPGRYGKRYTKHKEKKVHAWQQDQGAKGDGGEARVSKEEKAVQRRVARDKKREGTRNALTAFTQVTAEVISTNPSGNATASVFIAEVGLEATTLAQGADGLHAAMIDYAEQSPETSPLIGTQRLAEDIANVVVAAEMEREPRLIVEALVVRKMSIEEATLDFSRLALDI